MANTKSIDLESGSSQYLSISDGSQTGLDLSTDFTIMFWLKPETVTGSTIFNKYESGVGGYLVEIGGGGASLKLLYSPDGTNKTELTISPPTVDVWAHYAIAVDVSTPASTVFYKNGTSQSVTQVKTAATSLSGSGANFHIGATQAGTETFDGKLDEIGVYSAQLSAATVQSDYNSGDGTDRSSSESNIIAGWRFEDDLLDVTSNDNDLTNNNSATYSTDVPFSGSAATNRHQVIFI